MKKLDLILLAGGKGPLVQGTGYASKALIPIHGKPMLEWVIDAYRQCDCIGNIVVAGPRALDRLPTMRHVRRRVPSGRSLLQSFLHAALYTKLRLQQGGHNGYLVSCCDGVFLTPDVIDAAVENIRRTNPDVALHYVERGTYARAGLDVARTFIPVGDGEYTGTTIYYVRKLRLVLGAIPAVQKARKYRKQPLELLSLLGEEPRSPNDVQRILSARLSAKVGVFVLDRPEAGMDVDSAADLELAHRWLDVPRDGAVKS